MNLIYLVTFILLFYNLTKPIHALIPIECAKNLTLNAKVCCPINKFNGQVCGGQKRGYCAQLILPDEPVPHVFESDDRLRFPLKLFQYTCKCKGNYFGVSCETCWFGWKGRKCNKKDIRIRRDIRSLSKKDLEIFKNVYVASQKWPSGYYVLDESTNNHSDPIYKPKFQKASVQYYITFLHRYGSRTTLFKNTKDCDEYGILNFNHDGPVFATWHRYYTLIWERFFYYIAYKLYGVKNFAVPYWDWLGIKHCDVCNDKYLGGPGKRDEDGLHISPNSVFQNLTDFCFEPEDGMSCYGCQKYGKVGTITREFNSYDFSDQKDMIKIMKMKRFFVPGERNSHKCESFHMALEGYCSPTSTNATNLWFHNQMHVIIDGSMCCAATASNDPMFLVHHAYMDKIFTAWMKKHKPPIHHFPKKNVRPGHSLYAALVGMIPVVTNADMFIMDTKKLGYCYDTPLYGVHAENGQAPLMYPN